MHFYKQHPTMTGKTQEEDWAGQRDFPWQERARRIRGSVHINQALDLIGA